MGIERKGDKVIVTEKTQEEIEEEERVLEQLKTMGSHADEGDEE
jgi:hypothetical protein